MVWLYGKNKVPNWRKLHWGSSFFSTNNSLFIIHAQKSIKLYQCLWFLCIQQQQRLNILSQLIWSLSFFFSSVIITNQLTASINNHFIWIFSIKYFLLFYWTPFCSIRSMAYTCQNYTERNRSENDWATLGNSLFYFKNNSGTGWRTRVLFFSSIF